jgi:hypothetical protein
VTVSTSIPLHSAYVQGSYLSIVILVLSVMLLAVLYSLFVAVGRPLAGAFAGRHLSLPTSLVTTTGPPVGPAQPPCNYPFPTLIGYGPSTKLCTREERV